MEHVFREDRQHKLKITKSLQLSNRVFSQSIDEEQEINHSICNQDAKRLISDDKSKSTPTINEERLNLNFYPYGRPMSRTLECEVEQVLKEQNDLLRQLSVDHESKSKLDKLNAAYINRNYYYEDYHDSPDQDSEQFID